VFFSEHSVVSKLHPLCQQWASKG